MPRNRFCLAALALALAAMAAPATAAAKGFDYGVAAGEVSATTAKVWTRAGGRGTVTVQLGTKRSKLRRVAKAKATSGRDYTVTVTLRRLKPDRTYYYGFRQGSRRSEIGRFRTAPKPNANKTIRFAWSGDTDAQPLEPGAPPFWNRFQIYDRMRKENNAFNVNIGDTIYSDTEVGTVVEGRSVPAAPHALTVGQKWAKYKMGLSQAPLRRVRASTGLYSHWDDHEFINDFSVPEMGRTLYKAGVTAFRDYAPVTWSAKNGLYRSFRWGRNLEVFFLDERSFRSAKASANHVCDNPADGQPDLAPTAPASTRAFFGALLPSLNEPVSEKCLETINDPSRTFLGRRQYDRFTKAVRASKATWKVVMNETPIQQFYALPYDRWEGFAAERKKLLTYLRDHVKNVIFLTTDVHANLVNDARLQTLEEGGPIDTGILDVTTGPVATKSFAREIDDAGGIPGAGELVTNLFFKPQPPSGVGMTCAATDVFSYGQVEVTSKRLTVRLKDMNGQLIKDAGTDKPCAPIVLVKK